MTRSQVIEAIEKALSYDKQHGQEGKWTYELLKEALESAYEFIEKA